VLPVLHDKTLGYGRRRSNDPTQVWSDSEAEAVDYQNSLVEFATKYAEPSKDDLDVPSAAISKAQTATDDCWDW